MISHMFILHLPNFLPRNRISGILTTVEITGTARAKKARPQRGTIFARYKCATVSSESKPLSFLCTNTAQPAYSSSQICLRKQPPEERETGADPGPAFYLLSTKICKSFWQGFRLRHAQPQLECNSRTRLCGASGEMLQVVPRPGPPGLSCGSWCGQQVT